MERDLQVLVQRFNGGSLPPFYDLLSPHLFSRSQIRTINSHGDGIQLKEAIPTSPLSGLSLESLLSLSLSFLLYVRSTSFVSRMLAPR